MTTIIRSPAVLTKEAGSLIIVVTRETRATAEEPIKMKGTGYHVIIFDPSHIRKSGKFTFGKGRFWSGCDNESKSGLEIGGIAVGGVEHHTAFHYEAIQTPNAESLKLAGKNLPSSLGSAE